MCLTLVAGSTGYRRDGLSGRIGGGEGADAQRHGRRVPRDMPGANKQRRLELSQSLFSNQFGQSRMFFAQELTNLCCLTSLEIQSEPDAQRHGRGVPRDMSGANKQRRVKSYRFRESFFLPIW